MWIPEGAHRLGPDHATLTVRTGKNGVASKAGHELLIEVTAWSAMLHVGGVPASTTVQLTADATSLKVREGAGGMQALTDDEKLSIEKTIDDDVLKGSSIRFCSHAVESVRDGEGMLVTGELELAGENRPFDFELWVDDAGHLMGATTLKQTNWGITPYSTLFGALRVNDEVRIALCGQVPPT